VPWPERLARSESLRELSLRKKLTFAQSLLGQTFTLLLETETEGLTENYLRVELEKPAEAGALLPVTLTKADFEEGEVRVFGRLLPEPADLPPHSNGGLHVQEPLPR
jgi:tRNA A37 methylthiotransferase MiaB